MVPILESGFWGLATIGAGALGFGLTVLLAILSATRLRIPAGLWALGSLVTIGCAALGTIFGAQQALTAVRTAPTEMGPVMMAAGFGVSLYTMAIGTALGAGVSAIGAWLSGFASLVAARHPKTQFSVAPAAALIGIAAAVVLAVALAWVGLKINGLETGYGPTFACVALIASAVGSALAFLQRPLDDDDLWDDSAHAAAAEKLISLRAAAVWQSALAVFLVAAWSLTYGTIGALVSVAHASAELLRTMLAGHLYEIHYGATLVFLMASLFAILGLLAVRIKASRFAKTRLFGMISMAPIALCVLISLAMPMTLRGMYDAKVVDIARRDGLNVEFLLGFPLLRSTEIEHDCDFDQVDKQDECLERRDRERALRGR